MPTKQHKTCANIYCNTDRLIAAAAADFCFGTSEHEPLLKIRTERKTKKKKKSVRVKKVTEKINNKKKLDNTFFFFFSSKKKKQNKRRKLKKKISDVHLKMISCADNKQNFCSFKCPEPE